MATVKMTSDRATDAQNVTRAQRALVNKHHEGYTDAELVGDIRDLAEAMADFSMMYHDSRSGALALILIARAQKVEKTA